MLISAESTGTTTWSDLSYSANNFNATTTGGVLPPSDKKSSSASHHSNGNCSTATLVSCNIPAEQCPFPTQICGSDCLHDWSGEEAQHTGCGGTDHCVVVECDDPSRQDCTGACHDDINCSDSTKWLECMLCLPPSQGTTMDDCNQCSGHTTGDLRASLAHSQPNAANVFNDFPELAYLAQAPPPSTSQLIQPIQTQRQSFPNSRTMLNSGFLEHLKPPAYSSPIGHHHMSEERKDIVCLWGACRDSFSTQAELIAHVNAIHLGDPSSSIPIPQASLLPTDHAQPQLLHSSCSMQPSLACHWGNCGLSPSSLQSGSMPLAHHQEFSSLSVLANHLLQDHLGLPLPANLESLIGMNATAQQANLLAVAPSLQVPQAPQNTSRTMTSPTLADSPTPMLTDLVPSPPPTASTLSPTPGTPSPTSPEHKCCWTGCGKTFDTVDDLSTHVVDQHVGGGKGVYSCRWEGCDRNGAKAFSSKQKILRHLQTHTGHRPFVCPTCGQHFSEAATLQQHQRRHTSEKPYVCDHPGCGKSFAVAGALTIHKRTHSGVKPFKCIPYVAHTPTEPSLNPQTSVYRALPSSEPTLASSLTSATNPVAGSDFVDQTS